jgi:superfamily II DNA helicase RecQ
MALLTQFHGFFISPFGDDSDCDDLNQFLRSHRIVNIEKKLIDGERGTGWLFLVEYGNETKAGGAQGGAAQPKVDYKEVLSAEEFAVYDRLRRLRKEMADKQGLPPYAVFNNEQLAAMVRKKDFTLKDLAALPGVGESRIKQYGAVFIKALNDAKVNAPVPAADATNTNEQVKKDEAGQRTF